MVNLKERTTAWGEILKSFWIGSAKEDDNEEYKKWEEMNSKYLRDTNKSIQGLEEGTSAPKGGKVSRKQRKLSRTQPESTQISTDNRENGKDTRQRNGGGISR